MMKRKVGPGITRWYRRSRREEDNVKEEMEARRRSVERRLKLIQQIAAEAKRHA